MPHTVPHLRRTLHGAPYLYATRAWFTHRKVFAYYGLGQFNFAGDDDVWVFINFRLAVSR